MVNFVHLQSMVADVLARVIKIEEEICKPKEIKSKGKNK